MGGLVGGLVSAALWAALGIVALERVDRALILGGVALAWSPLRPWLLVALWKQRLRGLDVNVRAQRGWLSRLTWGGGLRLYTRPLEEGLPPDLWLASRRPRGASERLGDPSFDAGVASRDAALHLSPRLRRQILALSRSHGLGIEGGALSVKVDALSFPDGGFSRRLKGLLEQLQRPLERLRAEALERLEVEPLGVCVSILHQLPHELRALGVERLNHRFEADLDARVEIALASGALGWATLEAIARDAARPLPLRLRAFEGWAPSLEVGVLMGWVEEAAPFALIIAAQLEGHPDPSPDWPLWGRVEVPEIAARFLDLFSSAAWPRIEARVVAISGCSEPRTRRRARALLVERGEASTISLLREALVEAGGREARSIKAIIAAIKRGLEDGQLSLLGEEVGGLTLREEGGALSLED